MNQTKRNYRATFILDNRGKEETADTIIDSVKKEIAAVQGEVTGGRKPRQARFRAGDRPQVHRAASTSTSPFPRRPQGPAQLKERLRLNHSVYRTFVESV